MSMSEEELAEVIYHFAENKFQVQPGEPEDPRGEGYKWFLLKMGEKVFEISCQEVDPGARMEEDHEVAQLYTD